ncbi:MAG: DUF4863 family protein [Planctomycetes bacterium]|nr:DUF4863 family protein [Planctomycetota bacterium]
MSMDTLATLLGPIARELSRLSLSDPKAAESSIESSLPFEGDVVRGLRKATMQGVAEGWLLPKVNGDIRFGRVAKNLEGFSVDAVLMRGPGPQHRHPNGEIDLCFATSGDPQFDGRDEGWVVFGANSVHVPTVTKGEMVILYFLPGGAMEFL